MVSASEIVDIVEIIYFAPALLLSVYVCTKHGFKREAGWLLLVILSIIRIVGASCGIAATHDRAQGLIVTSLIMSSVGSATLVAAFTGITNRIAEGSRGSPLSPRQRKLIQIIGLVAIVLGIMGGIKVTDTDPSSREQGQTYMKAAVMLILLQFLISVAILSYSAIHLREILDDDRKLFFCASFAVPFLFVRLLYSILAAFDSNSSIFSLLSTSVTAVVLKACLGVAMEIIVVSLFILAGMLSPKMAVDHKSTEERAVVREGLLQVSGKTQN